MAAEVQAIRTTHPDDLTASAIAGTAARLIFATSAWGQRDVSAVVTGADTITTWWRAQTLAWGLTDLTEREFKTWSREKSLTFGGSDDAHNQLFAAALAANHLGSQGDWAHASTLLGMDTLIRLSRNGSPDEARSGLSLLRQSGDEGALKLAVNRLRTDGPASAIRLEASEIRLDSSTRTTGPTDLVLLQHGGDVVDEATADRSVAWLLESVVDPAAFVAPYDPFVHDPAPTRRDAWTSRACVISRVETGGDRRCTRIVRSDRSTPGFRMGASRARDPESGLGRGGCA